MININRYTLSNGLRVIHNEDNTTQMVALNLLYDVGARDEDPDHTGFAHLFEHLMFGGSIHVPDYDTPVQNAGGENNAWTNNDITNYYITLPRQNVETGFWLDVQTEHKFAHIVSSYNSRLFATFIKKFIRKQ